MGDRLSKVERSALMGKVRGVDTRPELVVRHLLHRDGYRFRLHRKDLPGSPDIVFSARRKVIFIHGCFWHRHQNCRMASTPTTRTGFWLEKFAQNQARDQRAQADLIRLGWQIMVVWECETRNSESLRDKLHWFLGAPKAF